MNELNKYAEIDSSECPQCGNSIKPHWKACPECGELLRSGSRAKTKSKKGAADDPRFVCKGCGEKAISADGFYCEKCACFIHKKCLNGRSCPICKKQLDKSVCFISTAASQSLGHNDSCRELNLLRLFRDSYMLATPRRRQQIEMYYRIAPRIVCQIESSANAASIWRHLWFDHIRPAVAAIERGLPEEAHKRYVAMMRELRTEFFPGKNGDSQP